MSTKGKPTRSSRGTTKGRTKSRSKATTTKAAGKPRRTRSGKEKPPAQNSAPADTKAERKERLRRRNARREATANSLATVDKSTLSVAEQAKVEAIEQMRAGLLRKHEEVEKLQQEDTRNTLETRYKIGEILVDVTDNEDKYQPKAIALLLDSSGISRSYARFYTALVRNSKSWEEVEKLAKKRSKTKRPISQQHIFELYRVPDPKTRRMMLDRWVETSMDCSEFGTWVTETLKQDEQDRASDNPLERASVTSTLGRAIAALKSTVDRFDKLNSKSVRDELRNLSPNTTNIEKLESFLAAMDQVVNHVETQRDWAESVKNELAAQYEQSKSADDGGLDGYEEDEDDEE